MSPQKEDFQTKFFNLEGVHFTERKKNFSKLLKSINPEELKDQLEFEPRNHLEKIFYVDALIHAKLVDKLTDILNEGTGILVAKILKQPWFFKEVVGSMSGADVVNTFLPSLSHVVRLKVMKKIALAVDECKMDEIFDHLLDRYGLFMAQSFLFGCSPTKIVAMIQTHPFRLSIEQLKRILDIDTNLVKLYFQAYEKHMGRAFDDPDFFNYMYCKYPALYFELEKYAGTLGRQTTKKILELDTNKVLNIDRTLKDLHSGTLTRKIPYFETKYFVRVLPESIEGLSYNNYKIRKFLVKYPVKRRWNIFASAFGKKYQEDLNNHLHILDRSVANLFSKDVVEKWAEMKLIETDDLSYLNEFKAAEAFSVIKDRINITSDIDTRFQMLQQLIVLCHKAQDYTTYDNVLKYIYFRHKNEKESVRRNLLRQIANNVDVRLTTEDHWVSINQMIDVFRAKKERLPVRNMTQYIIFLLKKSLSSDEAISQYFEYMVAGNEWDIQYLTSDLEIAQQAIEEFMKRLNDIPGGQRKTVTLQLLNTILDLNDRHEHMFIDINQSDIIASYVKDIVGNRSINNPEDSIFLTHVIRYNYGKGRMNPIVVDEVNLMETVKSALNLKHDNFDLVGALCKVAKKPRCTEFQENLVEFLFSQMTQNTVYFRDFICYCLRCEPEIIVKYSPTIFDLEKKAPYLDLKLVKLYSHLKLDDNLIKHLLDFVKLNTDVDGSEEVIAKLSKIMSSEDYVDLIEEYFPRNNQPESTDSQELILQFEIIKALRNLDDPRALIPLLSTLCRGDYFQPSIPLLYKTLYHLDEYDALKTLRLLLSKAVSVRKHGVFLGFEVVPQKDSLELFNVAATRENNTSSKKYLFRGLLKYSLKNPSERLLIMLTPCFSFINIRDKELFGNIIDSLEKVPLAFSPLYLEHLLNFFDEMDQGGGIVAEYRRSLVRFIDRSGYSFYAYVKYRFFEKLVTNYFLTDFHLNDFVVNFLLFKGEDSYYSLIFKLVKERKTLHASQLHEFFNAFYGAVQSLPQLTIFKSYWEITFTHEESFGKYVCLQLLYLYYTAQPDIHEKVNSFLQEITLQYGVYSSHIACEALEAFLNKLICSNLLSDMDGFVVKLLKIDPNILNCFIATKLCRSNEEIISILKEVDNLTVRILFNRYCI